MKRMAAVTAIAAAAVLSIAAVLPGSPAQADGRVSPARPIVGVKMYEFKGDPKPLFRTFDELGINTLFISEALAGDKAFRAEAKVRRMPVFIILPIFMDPEALKADPGLAAITREGKPAKDDWVEFVCPSREEFRRRKVEWVRKVVSTLDPDGASLDFIRYFVYWEMVKPDRDPATLPDTCFCPFCMEKFGRETGIKVPEDLDTPVKAAAWVDAGHRDRWTAWKCANITSMVEGLATAARLAKPGIMVNLHAVPWRPEDFNGAIRRVAGQDFTSLSRIVDYISPMCYSLMQHRDAAWIASVAKGITAVSSAFILPSIQVRPSYPGDLPMDAAGFEAALDAALAPPSRGVVFWSWDHLAKEPGEMDVLRRRRDH